MVSLKYHCTLLGLAPLCCCSEGVCTPWQVACLSASSAMQRMQHVLYSSCNDEHHNTLQLGRGVSLPGLWACPAAQGVRASRLGPGMPVQLRRLSLGGRR